jgi:hypothetical protein
MGLHPIDPSLGAEPQKEGNGDTPHKSDLLLIVGPPLSNYTMKKNKSQGPEKNILTFSVFVFKIHSMRQFHFQISKLRDKTLIYTPL